MVKIGKITEKHYHFVNISGTKGWIFMKFYVVVKYYLVTLSFKFHEDLCINARAQDARAYVLS